MSWLRPHVAAPARFSAREAIALTRLAASRREPIPLPEAQRLTRARRLLRAPFVMTGSEAAWACCVEVRVIARAIRSGRLPAERETLSNGWHRWRILRTDLKRFAAGLE